jgi:hypothetical protein
MKALAYVVAAALLGGCSGDWSGAPPYGSTSPAASQSSDETTGRDGGGANHAGGGSARDAGHNPDPGAFGASCTSGSECESNVCFEGGQGGRCSLACTSDSQCPSGEDGTRHCNPHGYCRY